MSNLHFPAFRRADAAILAERLREPPRFLQIVTCPRQVGKTTLVEQVVAEANRPSVIVSADEPPKDSPANGASTTVREPMSGS